MFGKKSTNGNRGRAGGYEGSCFKCGDDVPFPGEMCMACGEDNPDHVKNGWVDTWSYDRREANGDGWYS